MNITVDDTFGDPITGAIPEYTLNNGTWLAGFPGQDPATCNCHISTAIVDITQIRNGTWHDTTPLHSDPPTTITVHFTGSAVYVFNILPNTLPVTITLANVSFSIDGEDVGAFVHSPEPGTSILYNQLVYHNTTLDYGPHTIVITPSSYSLILFDYLLYTAQNNDTSSSETAPQLPSSTSPNGTPQPSSTSLSTPTSTSTPDRSVPSAPSRTQTPVGNIVGPVVGAAALLGVVVVAFFLYQRHTRSKLDTETNTHESKHSDDLAHGEGRSGPGHQVERVHWYSFSALPTSATPTFPLNGARAHNLPEPVSDLDASGPLLAGADASPGLPPAAVERSANCPSLGELTRRLAALQRTMSTLSSQTPSCSTHSEVTSEGGTETAIWELEAEMAQLCDVLTALNVWLADSRGGCVEPLPGYAY